MYLYRFTIENAEKLIYWPQIFFKVRRPTKTSPLVLSSSMIKLQNWENTLDIATLSTFRTQETDSLSSSSKSGCLETVFGDAHTFVCIRYSFCRKCVVYSNIVNLQINYSYNKYQNIIHVCIVYYFCRQGYQGFFWNNYKLQNSSTIWIWSIYSYYVKLSVDLKL